MTGFSTGPPFLVHILILAAANSIVFPLFYQWTGSILYAFLVSVGGLCVYGVLALRLFGKKRK